MGIKQMHMSGQGPLQKEEVSLEKLAHISNLKIPNPKWPQNQKFLPQMTSHLTSGDGLQSNLRCIKSTV
jgi:hypothetical protein